VIHFLGHANDIVGYMTSGAGRYALALFDTRWHHLENFGRWIKGDAAGLSFQTNTAPSDEIVIYLTVTTVSWLGKTTRLSITINDELLEKSFLAADVRQSFMTKAKPRDGRVDIEFGVFGGGTKGAAVDTRELSVGLAALGYAPADDLKARLQLLEEAQAAAGLFVILPASNRSRTLDRVDD
jgi:hypothetical protein